MPLATSTSRPSIFSMVEYPKNTSVDKKDKKDSNF